jgi:uncharacterized membrane protein YfcA
VSLSVLDYVVAGGATAIAGAINALAGGGTLVSFPALVAIGVPSLSANVTNTVALCPGYLSGTLAQREDLQGQKRRVRWLAVAAGLGGLTGSALLEITPESTFRAAVPWLLVLSCVLLASQDRVRGWVRRRSETRTSTAAAPALETAAETGDASPEGGTLRPPAVLIGTVFAGAVYGGFFGAGLGIMLLALLGLFLDDTMVRVNAVKQVLQFAINILAAAFFAVSGHVRWELVPVMGVAGILGGTFGGRLVRVVNPTWLRRAVVVFGLAVAVEFWIS